MRQGGDEPFRPNQRNNHDELITDGEDEEKKEVFQTGEHADVRKGSEL